MRKSIIWALLIAAGFAGSWTVSSCRTAPVGFYLTRADLRV